MRIGTPSGFMKTTRLRDEGERDGADAIGIDFEADEEAPPPADHAS